MPDLSISARRYPIGSRSTMGDGASHVESDSIAFATTALSRGSRYGSLTM